MLVDEEEPTAAPAPAPARAPLAALKVPELAPDVVGMRSVDMAESGRSAVYLESAANSLDDASGWDAGDRWGEARDGKGDRVGASDGSEARKRFISGSGRARRGGGVGVGASDANRPGASVCAAAGCGCRCGNQGERRGRARQGKAKTAGGAAAAAAVRARSRRHSRAARSSQGESRKAPERTLTTHGTRSAGHDWNRDRRKYLVSRVALAT